jgi:hypothetical protein
MTGPSGGVSVVSDWESGVAVEDAVVSGAGVSPAGGAVVHPIRARIKIRAKIRARMYFVQTFNFSQKLNV